MGYIYQTRGNKKGEILGDNKFQLYENDAKGNTDQVRYKGAYIIVDNKYLSWSTTVPPFTNHGWHDKVRWYEWVKNMRKDVECMFGILEGCIPLNWWI